MKYLKKFENFNISDSVNEDYNQQMVVIKNEYTKLKNGVKKGEIYIGDDGKVSDITIKNLKQTYKDAIVSLKDGKWVMCLESHLNSIGSFEENLAKLSNDEKIVYNLLKEYGDMSNWDCLKYAAKDMYYEEHGDDYEAIAKELRDAYEEDNAPSEDLQKVKKAIEDGRLKIVKSGEKMFGKLKLRIDEYVWARNYMDGFGIDVYSNDGHEGTIHLLAPDWKPEIYKG